MYITALTIDAEGGNASAHIAAPTFPAVEAALRSLDGQHRTLVMLEHDEDHWLAIGGGNHDRYVVTVTDNATYYLAMSPDAPEGAISLVVDGQEAEWALQETSELASALLAAQAYARDGALAADLTWKTH